MIIGTTVYDAVKFIDALYKDISRLIDAVDGGMQASDYVSVWGGACYFNSSKALGYPGNWAPHSFTRVYVPSQRVKTYSDFAFLNIYLTPKHHRQPLVHWGLGRRKSGVDILPTWNSGFLGMQGPNFLRTSEIDPFQDSGECPTIIEDFRYAVQPLINMNTEDVLERMVLAPIRSEINSLATSALEPTDEPGPDMPSDEPR